MKMLWLTLAYAVAVTGMAWLALSMDTHWHQARAGRPPGRRLSAAMRAAGALGLLGSLAFCLGADHASIAVLVWIMLLAAAALTVTFVLSWRPLWLRPLVAGFGALREGRPGAESATIIE